MTDDRHDARSQAEPPWVAVLREQGAAGRLYCRLHGLMAALGFIFLVVVVSERIAPANSDLTPVLRITGITIWGIFVTEFVARVALLPNRRRFLRKNWWHALLLAVPFLNIVRAGSAIRVTRLGRVVSASLRGTRTARSRFAGRVGTVVTVNVAVILVGTDLAFEFAGIRPYSTALHDVAMATLTGQPMSGTNGVSRTMEVFLAAYSAIFFAALAAALGALFLERRGEEAQQEAAEQAERRAA